MAKRTNVFSVLITIVVILYDPIVYGMIDSSNTLVFQGETCTAILREEPLKNIVEKFRIETGIWFSIPESELDERVSVQFENLSIKEGLKRILRTKNYSFLFDDDNHLIGAFIFPKATRGRKATAPVDLNEQMAEAIIKGDTAAVAELLAKGADINAKGKYSGWTPLIIAAKKGDTELVNLLLSQGADVNLKSNVRNRTAIMEAARNRKVDTLKALLSADPDVNAADWEGYTVLMFAAVSGQSDIVDVLLKHGADVNRKNKVGSSALMMAAGYPNVSQKLKDAGAEEQ